MQTRALSFTIASGGKPEDRRVTFVASTMDVDRHGTRLHPRGCRSEAFLKNPVFLWNHNKDGEPDDVLGTVVSLTVTDAEVVAVVEFEGPENKKATRCLQKVRKKTLRAVSVGFIPIQQAEPDADGVIDVTEWELAELSLVPVGSNRAALKRGLGFTLRAMPINVASVLVRRQSDRAQLWGRRRDSGLYTTPGGKFNAGELPGDAAVRELKEEAAIVATPQQLIELGVVDVGKAVVHCFTIDVPDQQPSSANDPDHEVGSWEWLQQAPPPEEMHARPNALERWVGARSRTSRTYTQNGGNPAPATRRSKPMNPADILAKLGLAEGAAPETIAPALLKYCAGPDAEADKVAVINGVLSMLAPAAAEPSASSDSDGARAAALEATTEEMRRLQSRVAELEDAAKKPEPPKESAEERADAAIRNGQWPLSQRAALVAQFAGNRTPYLHPAKTFTNRGLQITAGGSVIAPAKAAPNFGAESPALSKSDALAVELLKRSGVDVTPENFAAAAKAQA